MIETIDWQKANLKKISVKIDGHATSISLEPIFLDFLKNIAQKNEQSFASFIAKIDSSRPENVNLSAALRFYAMHHMLNTNMI